MECGIECFQFVSGSSIRFNRPFQTESGNQNFAMSFWKIIGIDGSCLTFSSLSSLAAVKNKPLNHCVIWLICQCEHRPHHQTHASCLISRRVHKWANKIHSTLSSIYCGRRGVFQTKTSELATLSSQTTCQLLFPMLSTTIPYQWCLLHHSFLPLFSSTEISGK